MKTVYHALPLLWGGVGVGVGVGEGGDMFRKFENHI